MEQNPKNKKTNQRSNKNKCPRNSIVQRGTSKFEFEKSSNGLSKNHLGPKISLRTRLKTLSNNWRKKMNGNKRKEKKWYQKQSEKSFKPRKSRNDCPKLQHEQGTRNDGAAYSKRGFIVTEILYRPANCDVSDVTGTIRSDKCLSRPTLWLDSLKTSSPNTSPNLKRKQRRTRSVLL